MWEIRRMGEKLELTVEDFEDCQWWDSWSEGPYSLKEVMGYVQNNPRNANTFHTRVNDNFVTYNQYLEIKKQSGE